MAMKLRFMVFSLIVAVTAKPAVAHAQLGVNFSAATGFTNGSWSLGWSFTALNTFSVIGLGFYDDGQNGLSQSHDVGIYTDAGVLVGSTTVLATDPLLSFWRFASVTPFTLTAGTTYRIAGVTGAENYPLNGVTGLVVDPNIAFGQDEFTSSTSLVFPTASDLLSDAWLAPNFEVSSVPEPTTMGLMATGLVGLAGIRRRRKTTAA